ncbi:MAG: hypothetical protein ABWZ66_00640 [Pyrinomonadaceae bacterium]
METGHEKNVKNFETVIIILVSLGVIYSPSQALILLPALQAKLLEAKDAIAAVDAKEAEKSVAVDEQQEEFLDLDKYAVNIKRTAEVEINDAAFTKDLQSIVNKFRSPGKRSRTNTSGSAEDEDGNGDTRGGRSTSQRSYDMQINHLAAIIALLKTKAGAYKTNDAEYTIAAIETRLAALEAKNNAGKNAGIALGLAQDARDEILYNPDTGVLKLVRLIKLQLARKPGKQSAAYQQINALNFVRKRG